MRSKRKIRLQTACKLIIYYHIYGDFTIQDDMFVKNWTFLLFTLAKTARFIYNMWAAKSRLFLFWITFATVAQLVEQLIRNQQVAGSSPASSSKGRDNLCLLFFLFLKRISKFNSQQKISLRYGVRFCLFIRFEMFQKNI